MVSAHLSQAYPVTGYLLAFLVGLLSALHCFGMCGSIAGAIGCSLPEKALGRRSSYVIYQLLFNLGRTGSYAVAGALFGSLGAGLIQVAALDWLEHLMRLIAAGVLIGVGLHVGGWLPGLAIVERIGVPLWRVLEPLRLRLLPVTSPAGAVLLGLLWGWIPCGLVYSMLIGAPVQGGAMAGAVYMAAFGLGTLPAVLATGLFAGHLASLGREPRLQSLAGLTLIVLAVFTLDYQGYNPFSESQSISTPQQDSRS